MKKLAMGLAALWMAFAAVGANVLPELTEVDELARAFLESDAATWSALGDELAGGDEVARDALSRYLDFAELRDRLLAKTDEEMLKALERDRRWQQAYGEIRQVRRAYDLWRRAASTGSKQQWLEFARSALGSDRAVPLLKDGRTLGGVLEGVERHVKDRNLFNNALIRSLDEREACRLTTSPNRVIYELYETVALAQLEGHVVQQWSRALIALEGGPEAAAFAAGAAQAQALYEQTRKDTRERALSALEKSDRHIWKCDPDGGHTSKTYTELTELLQGHLENEKDMNPRSNCMQNCEYYDYTMSMGCYAGYCKQPKRRSCRGKLLECKYVASDMTVCEADRTSSRRYEYIEYDNSRTFGRNVGCPNSRTVRVESWWRWLFWHCSYCMCLCDDATSPRTDRYWSLRPVLSDSAHDMVVTGVRLTKVEKVIHLQIQQAKLASHGRANATSVAWRMTEPLKIDSPNTKDGKDYHTMSYEKRDLDLDDVTVPMGHVVTGVRWRLVGAHLNLEVLAAPVDWTSGRLIRPQEKSFWVSSDLTLLRNKLQLYQPDVPTRQIAPSKVDSESDTYIEFTHSDLDKDAGQTTVPFLDTQHVVTDPPAPLSGVGLYHKGVRGSGGFVAPKIMTYDYAPHMRD